MTAAERPVWERRFLAPYVNMPSWPRAAPDRCVLLSDEGGSMQAWAFDAATGERRRASDEPVGILPEEGCDPTPTPDGNGVAWFSDPDGKEAGTWVVAPFDGSAEAQPLLPDVPFGWYSGLALGPRTVAMAMGYDDGFRVYVSRDGGPARILHEHPEELRIPVPEWGGYNNAALSADERYLCIAHAESGNQLHYALRVYDLETFEPVGEQDDVDLDLGACVWMPEPGDQRLIIRHERTGSHRPAVWNVETGEVTDVPLDLSGEVDAYDVWPDGSAILISQSLDARSYLQRVEIATGVATPIDHPEGCVWGGGVRPDGSVWFRHDSGSMSDVVYSSTGEPVYTPATPPDAVLTGRPYASMHVANRDGEPVQGFLVTPDGEPPYPLINLIHGGPAWFWGDYWAPKVQAFADAGFAVALVNYRGTAGFGADWRDRLIRNIGFPETEDLNDWTDRLIADGIADPDRCAIGGASWGGYLTLLGIGMHPERWKAALGIVPVGDYVAGYEDSAPSLQAMDRAYLGAPPAEIPEFITPRSPITYVDDVACPVFILYGENDTRCPPRQVENYVNALREAGGDVVAHTYGTGHSSQVTDEEIVHVRMMLGFLAKHIPGIRVPG
ncbi:MAG: prolyl oligopeptidase family serine peptidase [Actinomycetota bacterium]